MTGLIRTLAILAGATGLSLGLDSYQIRDHEDILSNYNVLPVGGFTCYAGIQIGSTALVGAISTCSQAGGTGACASATTYIGAYKTTIFFCTTHAVCDALITPPPPSGNQCCSAVNGHPEYNISVCCCYSSANCNTEGFPNVPTPLPTLQPQTNRIPQACYLGIQIDGALLAGGSYVACQGNCVSFSFKYLGHYDFTMYSCDDSSANLCDQLSLTNDCMDLANGTIRGCCCDYDACIDPTVNPPKYPNGTVTPPSCPTMLPTINSSSCPKNSVIDSQGTSCYMALEMVTTHTRAEEFCESISMFGASIHNSFDNQVLLNYARSVFEANLPNASSFWLGGYYDGTTIQWADGSPFNYANFRVENAPGNVVVNLSDGKWRTAAWNDRNPLTCIGRV